MTCKLVFRPKQTTVTDVSVPSTPPFIKTEAAVMVVQLGYCHGRLKALTNNRRGHKKLKQGNHNLLKLTLNGWTFSTPKHTARHF